MTFWINRYLASDNRVDRGQADRAVFFATTGLCALGALFLPLAG